jgi:parvulin-like peptidyl-prolyl isomerase
MEAAVEASVFGASGGQVIGPFKLSLGWTLFKIEEINRASLDDAMRETIKNQIFDEWLSEAKRKAKPTIPLLEVEEEEEEEDDEE